MPFFADNARVTILEVDGKSVEMSIGKIEMLPGRHEIRGYCEVTTHPVVEYRRPGEARGYYDVSMYPVVRYSRPVTVTLTVEAGRTYATKDSCIIDKQTGAALCDFLP